MGEPQQRLPGQPGRPLETCLRLAMLTITAVTISGRDEDHQQA
jgi:hypothetical protein